ncbi:6-phosphogluconate dehydrogenase-related protein [Amycolatopsis mediterranei S699]|uniref:6-phosphogluconate dehydrogenase-related protein n=2 Tax=Amycolatopsis mediterranei TaxID=33910 RepID=A0A0H3DFL8_AMYMU|nr:NAD(P)-binding domain-containing protein [Amycolatopsis mediterranei]ADJ48893.1 6-phosphogluconate dehydrogenase-related protein [Amycolatopsis mediterranei U32]AEK45841.1 6-phosphogluconate dehydrogenase-related protein [Amycolatopsis mediterranei S699]AFO80601.1 6-phosphogluconate dehydrogenase-related protein [Amycolatopsis mediterranei S699]AGT87729.1 6-phosphogluconate dehydrogenase-related protein [Amycolatopsis mediterranei RB]KDU93990.1 6-phosphogluconate dehydrogenase [Amycolatopsi
MGTIGFVGAGSIGEPMVERLLAAGHPVRVFARRTEVRDRLRAAGAELVDRVRYLAACDVVVSCLYDDAQVLDVLPEVVREMAASTVLVSHTTGRPETLSRLAPMGKAAIVDAAFSGTAEAVRAGRLTVYLGGEPGPVATAREIVGAYADPVITTGSLGSALRVKLLNNLLFAAISQVTLRGLEAGLVMGIDESVLLEALAVGSGGSSAGRYIAARGGAERYVAAVTPFLRKDLAACRETAAGLGADLAKLLAAACDGPMDLENLENGVVR